MNISFPTLNKDQAIDAFWRLFDITPYEETQVPADAPYPYLTHESAVDDFGHEIAQTATLSYRSTSWVEITSKRNEIAEVITKGGRYVKYSGGAFIIRRASPWAQRMSDSADDSVRKMILNYTIEFVE